jgi:hypothetical protein
MSREPNEEFRLITELWLQRFGEPPPILTDADLMWQVMCSMPGEPPEDPRRASRPD